MICILQYFYPDVTMKWTPIWRNNIHVSCVL